MNYCEVCGEELEDGSEVKEVIWNEAVTLCPKCEQMLNENIIGRNQIQRGR